MTKFLPKSDKKLLKNQNLFLNWPKILNNKIKIMHKIKQKWKKKLKTTKNYSKP